MFGSTHIAAVLGAVPPGHLTDERTASSFLKSLVGAGLAPVLIRPAGEGEKRVADMRTDKEKAATADPVTGKPVGGVLTATTDLSTLKKYVRRYFKSPDAKRQKGTPAGFGNVAMNIGIHLGRSNLIVADADYPSEVDAFRTWFATTYDVPLEKVPAPTVTSPGTLNADGTRNHHGGGHWYFSVPRDFVDLSDSPVASRDVSVDPDLVEQVTGHRYDRCRFALKTGHSYVLIPPSVRTAGPYTLHSPDPDVDPLILLDALGAVVDDGHVTSTVAPAVSGPDYSDELPATDMTPHYEALQRVAVDIAEQAPVPTLTPGDSDGDLFGAIGGTPLCGQASPEDVEDVEDVPVLDTGTLDDRLARWWESTSWDEILTGWTPAGRDECGCPTYTRPHDPGESVTPKSLTAHEAGCSRGRTDDRHPAAHIWSDHVDDALLDMTHRHGRTLSAFAVFTAVHHDGDFTAACRDAGIPSGLAQDLSGLGLTEDDMRTVEPTAPATMSARRDGDTPYPTGGFVAPVPAVPGQGEVTDTAGRDVLEAWGVSRPEDGVPTTWSPFGPLSAFRGVEPPGWIVQDMLQLDGLLSVVGDSGSGKSAVIIDLLCTIASGVGTWFGRKCASFPVVYVAGEGFEGAVARMRAWERVNRCEVGDRVFIVPEAVALSDSTGAWAWVSQNARAVGAGLVVVDTFARSATGLDENSATDMGSAVSVLDKVRRTTGASVMVVHHTARGTDRARGSNALRGAVDSELLVEEYGDPSKVTTTTGNPLPVGAHPITVTVSKQKNGRDDAELSLTLVDEKDARRLDGSPAGPECTGLVVVDRDLQPALTGATFGHAVAANFDPIPLPEVSDTAERVAEYLARFDTLARTLSQIHNGVTPPPGVQVPKSRWNDEVDKAVDYALSMRTIVKRGASFVHKDAADPDE